MSSVRLSVCDVGGSGPQGLKVLETNCTSDYPNIFGIRSPKVIHLLPGEHGEIFRRKCSFDTHVHNVRLNWVNRESRDLWWRRGCLFTFVDALRGHLCDSTAFLYFTCAYSIRSDVVSRSWSIASSSVWRTVTGSYAPWTAWLIDWLIGLSLKVPQDTKTGHFRDGLAGHSVCLLLDMNRDLHKWLWRRLCQQHEENSPENRTGFSSAHTVKQDSNIFWDNLAANKFRAVILC